MMVYVSFPDYQPKYQSVWDIYRAARTYLTTSARIAYIILTMTQYMRILNQMIKKGIAVYRCQQLLKLVKVSDKYFWTGSARTWGMHQIAATYNLTIIIK